MEAHRQRITYTSVYIPKRVIAQSVLPYEAVLLAHGIQPTQPYLRVDSPRLESWHFLQPPPPQEVPHG